MSRKTVKEFSDGDVVDEVFLLAEKQLRANRNADLYLLATLRDKTGVISGLMWNVVEDSLQHINAGDFVRARGKVQLYQGGLQMILTRIESEHDPSLDPEDFHPQLNHDVGPLLDRLRDVMLGLDNLSLRALMESFLTDDELMKRLATAPAGIKAHHAYQGGLLEHSLNMMEVAIKIDPLYPNLDTELLLVGIFLHDLGKIRELEWDATFAYTNEGQLLGHMQIACEILHEKIKETVERTNADFPEETILRLKHMILSHHGAYEYGSPRLPMTPEAIALHLIDNLDAKLHEFTHMIQDDPNGESQWTPFVPRIDRKIFKGARTSE